MKVLLLCTLLLLLHVLIAIWIGFLRSLLLTSRFELKKRAQSLNQQAKVIYGLTADGRQIYVAIFIGIVAAMSLVVLLYDVLFPALFAVVFATTTLFFGAFVLPFLYAEKLGLRVTEKLAPFAAKLLRYMSPITRPISWRIDAVVGKKSILYSKEQLLQIIEDQPKSPLADITTEEALLVKHSLEFSEKVIRSYMTPRRIVALVNEADQVGPILMNELHKSGHSRFPVVSKNDPEVLVGTLYLHDLVGDKKSGSVATHMSPKVYFVHEELTLSHALDAFIKTKHHLFIVVNNFEEFVGILTIEDVIEQLLGRQIMDEFDAYENLREVAALHAKKTNYDKHKKHV